MQARREDLRLLKPSHQGKKVIIGRIAEERTGSARERLRGDRIPTDPTAGGNGVCFVADALRYDAALSLLPPPPPPALQSVGIEWPARDSGGEYGDAGGRAHERRRERGQGPSFLSPIPGSGDVNKRPPPRRGVTGVPSALRKALPPLAATNAGARGHETSGTAKARHAPTSP